MSKPTAIIAIHGGTGPASDEMTPEREKSSLEALAQIVRAGQKLLAEGAGALDAVTEAVRLLENCPPVQCRQRSGLHGCRHPRVGRRFDGRQNSFRRRSRLRAAAG